MAHRWSRSRILFSTTVAWSIEAFINPVAAKLHESGHSIMFVTGDRLPQSDFDFQGQVLPMARGISLSLDAKSLSGWVTYLRLTRPDMVIAGTPKAALLAMTAAQITGVPCRLYLILGAVWDGATGIDRAVLEFAERRTIAASTDQVAVSDSLARLVYNRGLSRKVPRVIESGSFTGVDVQRFHPSGRSAGRRPHLVYVGRINRGKGVDVLLRTMDRICEKADAQLTVVGALDSSAPPDAATLQRLAEHPHINWVSDATDQVGYLQAADLLLFPSLREGLPQVPLEAQACAVPVVSWRATGIVDAVRDGFTGVLVELGDELSLARATRRLMADPEECGRLGANARFWVESRFRQDAVVDRNAAMIETLLRSRI